MVTFPCTVEAVVRLLPIAVVVMFVIGEFVNVCDVFDTDMLGDIVSVIVVVLFMLPVVVCSTADVVVAVLASPVVG